MRIEGKCHCANIAFVVDWPGSPTEITARQCGCSFCTKHGGVWTSHPDAKLSVTLQRTDAVSRYVFGTESATFHVCTRCGVVPFVTSEIANHVYGVVNVNTFENLHSVLLRRQPADFAGEDLKARLARRQTYWISDVRFLGDA
jgi:hypothetical protein